MHRKVAAFILAWLLTSSIAAPNLWAQDKPQTFASTSLCGDAYLLAIAPDQIMALSWQSRGPLSLASDTQKRLPQAWDDAERLIALAPDVVLFGPGEGYKTQAVLEATGIQTLRLEWGEDEEMLQENYAKFGEVFWAGSQKHYPDPKPKILYLTRSGGSAGSETYIDALITRIGGENIWTSHSSRTGWFTPDAEELAILKPDFIITSYMSDGFESAQAKMMTGGVHRRLLATTPSVEIPGKYLSCMAPQFYDAIQIADTALSEWRAAQ